MDRCTIDVVLFFFDKYRIIIDTSKDAMEKTKPIFTFIIANN